MVYSGGDDDGDMEMDAEGGGSKNRRHRTLRQQMLNKQAQQRYRCGHLMPCSPGAPCDWYCCRIAYSSVPVDVLAARMTSCPF